jgi:hypothetical protein
MLGHFLKVVARGASDADVERRLGSLGEIASNKKPNTVAGLKN